VFDGLGGEVFERRADYWQPGTGGERWLESGDSRDANLSAMRISRTLPHLYQLTTSPAESPGQVRDDVDVDDGGLDPSDPRRTHAPNR
jgi:hypothetical protein